MSDIPGTGGGGGGRGEGGKGGRGEGVNRCKRASCRKMSVILQVQYNIIQYLHSPGGAFQ